MYVRRSRAKRAEEEGRSPGRHLIRWLGDKHPVRVPLILAVVLAMGVAACGTNSSNGPASAAKTKPGGTITFAFDGEADGDFSLIEPQSNCAAICVSWFQAIFDPLIVPNTKTYQSTGQFSGVLAQSWSANANDTAFTFHLKPQAKFTNGQPVTSTDVQYSFNRACETSRLATSGFACSLIAGYEDTQIINAHTFIIHMKTPDPSFLADIAQGAYFGIVPASLIEKEGETAFGNNPVGSGPFKFVSWNKAQGIITLERNPDYTWGPSFTSQAGHPPPAQKLVIEYISNDQTRESAFESGQIQGFQNLPYSDVSQFKSDQKAQVLLPTYGGGTGWLYLNTASGPTADLAVRKAISEAVDRTAFNKTIFFNTGEPTRAFMLHIPDSDPNAQAPNYDVAAAKATLAADGWKAGPNGVLEKDGKPLTFIGVGTTDDEAALTLIQSELQAVGMKMTISIVSNSQTYTVMDNKSFGIWLGGSVWGFADPSPSLLYSVFDGTQLPPDGFNPSWFNNAAFNKEIGIADSAASASARSEAYTQAQQILAEQVPVDPVVTLPVVTVLAKNVAGIEPDATGGYLYFYDARYTQ